MLWVRHPAPSRTIAESTLCTCDADKGVHVCLLACRPRHRVSLGPSPGQLWKTIISDGVLARATRGVRPEWTPAAAPWRPHPTALLYGRLFLLSFCPHLVHTGEAIRGGETGLLLLSTFQAVSVWAMQLQIHAVAVAWWVGEVK